MVVLDPFRQLRDLDNTSPQFHKELIDFFGGDDYRDVFPKLETEDLEWLAEYLDGVSLRIIFVHIVLSIGVGSPKCFRSRKPRIPVVFA